MSTKQTTSGNNTTAFQFDPNSMAAYQKNLGSFLPFAQSLYQNPFGNDMFNQESTIGQDQAIRMGRRGVSNVAQNAAGLGYSTSSPLFNSMLQRAGMNTSNLQGQAFRNSIMNANQRAMTGLGISSSFQPLMTGSNSNFQQQQTTSGLGTWLPQLAGAAIGGAFNAFAPRGDSSGGSSGGGSGSMGGMGWNGTIGGFPGMNSGGVNGLGGLFPSSGYGYGSGSPMAPPNPFWGAAPWGT